MWYITIAPNRHEREKKIDTEMPTTRIYRDVCAISAAVTYLYWYLKSAWQHAQQFIETLLMGSTVVPHVMVVVVCSVRRECILCAASSFFFFCFVHFFYEHKRCYMSLFGIIFFSFILSDSPLFFSGVVCLMFIQKRVPE